MNNAQHEPTPADPARHEPSEARSATCTCCGGARQPDLTDYFTEVLKEFVELSRDLARVVVAEAQEEAAQRRAVPVPAEPRKPRRPADLEFSRVTRAARLCMKLAMEFQQERLAGETRIANDRAAEERGRKKRFRGQLGRLAEQAIERHVEKEIERRAESDEAFEYDEQAEADEKEALYDALTERLDEDDIERDLGECPQGEMLARICDYLGITPDWDLWRKAHWAMEEARRKVPGSPYAAPPALEPEEPKPPEAKPDEPKLEEPKPQEPEPPEPKVEEAKPEEPAAAPIRSYMDRLRYPTPDEQRAEEERKARIRARYSLGSG